MRLAFLDTPASRALKAGLDVGAMNHRLIADNIANADTPSFKGMRLDFDAYFAEARKVMLGDETPSRPDWGSFIFRDEWSTMRLDGNNIDPEREMAELASNTLNYAMLTELVNRRGGYMMMVLTEGRA